jgi:sec-independent protein translocase protein TatA
MFGLGIGELLVVLVIVLVVFGAGRLPEVMGSMGKGVQAFNEGAARASRDRRHAERRVRTPTRRRRARRPRSRARARVITRAPNSFRSAGRFREDDQEVHRLARRQAPRASALEALEEPDLAQREVVI